MYELNYRLILKLYKYINMSEMNKYKPKNRQLLMINELKRKVRVSLY